jgi:transformation/transcription domain-associated protein
MSAKLLLNLLEFIVGKNTGEHEGKGKIVVMRIFDTFVNKFGSLKKQIPRLFKPQVDKSDFGGDVQTTDNIKDCRLLMKSLVFGLKNITWAVNMCSTRQGQQGPPGTNLPPSALVTAEETFIYSRLLKNALRCLLVFSVGPNPAPQDEKEALDHFATMFTMVDSRIFQEVFNFHMPFLFERMLENQTMLTIPQHFLAHNLVSRIFADILLNFLMDRMKQLAGPDKTASVVLLRLFKLVFGSVTLFSDNEPVLQPHLATIVTMSLKYAGEVKDSMNYFVLLRALFRSIGGKFDALYKEFLPLLPGTYDFPSTSTSSSPYPSSHQCLPFL